MEFGLSRAVLLASFVYASCPPIWEAATFAKCDALLSCFSTFSYNLRLALVGTGTVTHGIGTAVALFCALMLY